MDLFNSWLVLSPIAHRGLHGEGVAENSKTAILNAIEKRLPIEIDVRLTLDNVPIVFHDDKLSRLTKADGYIESSSYPQIEHLCLLETQDKILTLQELLHIVDGKVPLLIEIKNSQKVGNYEKCIYKVLKNYHGDFAIQSFNPYTLEWFKNNAPNILRGQLSSYFKKDNLPWYKKFVLKRLLLNKRSQPHFIVYDHECLPNIYVKKYSKLPLLAFTIKTKKDYTDVVNYCDNVIFENYIPVK